MSWRVLIVLARAAACTPQRAPQPNPYADVARDCRSAAALLAPAREPTPEMAPPLRSSSTRCAP
jgi:hypothetical protein